MAIVGPGGALSAKEALRGGADLVQVRARDFSGRALVELARAVIAEVGNAGRVIVNSRPDIAELTGACGVHLPEVGLDSGEVRRAFPRLLLGVSRHDRSGLDRAVAEGADYAIMGPVLETPGKEDRILGAEGLREALRGLVFPVLAVGGIVPENAALLIQAGAKGVAAMRPFANSGEAKGQASSLRAALDLMR